MKPTGARSKKVIELPRKRGHDPDGTSSARLDKTLVFGASRINSKWAAHHRRLIELKDRLLSEKRAGVHDAAQQMDVYSMHMADSATDQFDRDLALGLLSARQDTLIEVEEAIRRIETGRYGICEITGKPIPDERLAAVPWTRFTAEAEEFLEKEGSIKRPRIGTLGRVVVSEEQNLALSPEEAEVEDQGTEAGDLTGLRRAEEPPARPNQNGPSDVPGSPEFR